MNLLKPKDPASKLEADLAGHRRRLEQLRAGLQRAKDDVKSATEARCALLLVEDAAIGGPALSKATEACRTAESNVAGVQGAITVVEARILEAEETIAGIRDRRERERLAGRLNSRAAEIEAVAADLDNAARAFADTRTRMRDILDRSGLSDGVNQTELLLRPIIDAAIRLAAPHFMPSDLRHEYGYAALPIGAKAAAAEHQVKPLRAWAAQILAGEAPAIEPGAPPAPMLHVEFQETVVVLRESIAYRGLDAREIQLNEGGGSIPAPVAEAAVKLGLAFPPDSSEGAKIMRELRIGQLNDAMGRPIIPKAKDGKPLFRRGPPYRLIDVNLYALAEAQRAAARAAA